MQILILLWEFEKTPIHGLMRHLNLHKYIAFHTVVVRAICLHYIAKLSHAVSP